MTKRIVFGVTVVALATVVMAPSASAACPGPRTAGTYNFQTGVARYWHLPAGHANGDLAGQAWQLGSPATFTSAAGVNTCNSMLYFVGPGTIGMAVDFSTCGTGCPSPGATLAFVATNTQPNGASSTLVATVAETGSGAVNFDYSSQPDHAMIEVPTPNIIGSGPRSGNLMPLHVSVPAFLSTNNGFYGPGASSSVSGYRIVSALSVNEPSRDAAVYTAPVTNGNLAAPGGAAVSDTLVQVDCGATPLQDSWVALQISFESGGVVQSAVSKPRRVHCQGAMADPKFKPIKKKPVALGAREN